MRLVIFLLSALLTGTAFGAEGRARALVNIPASEPFEFAVFGDNRGDDSGEQPPTFLQILRAIGKETPAFALDSGDMIYGHNLDPRVVREHWRLYERAVSRLSIPIFHVPGNHDIWSSTSSRIYQQLWGPPYFDFRYGNSLLIGLDTESARNQLDDAQFRWLENQLTSCTQSNVFLFMHSPLFPVDGAIGSSLDRYPAKRDQLHRLFVQHRNIIRAVFTGHEHLYTFQERDGVRYYTSGGAGAPLYTAPELGGFHHFLLVHVNGNEASVELKKVCAPTSPLKAARKIQAGELLEEWKKGLFWYAWDRSANIESVDETASEGQKALRLNFDLVQYSWPVLVLPLVSPQILRDYESLSLDVYVPKSLGAKMKITPAVHGLTKHESASIGLAPGWNTIVTHLDEAWLPRSERVKLEEIEWGLSGESEQANGYVIFDNLHGTRKVPNQAPVTEMIESWERPLLWRIFDETLAAETGPDGLVVHLNWVNYKRPALFARLNAPWDLSAVSALELQVQIPPSVPKGVSLQMTLRAHDTPFAGPSYALTPGSQTFRFPLNGNWLPQEARKAVDQIGFTMISDDRIGQVDIRFQRLAAGPEN
jgi:Calcineurin-like phosphoesterase